MESMGFVLCLLLVFMVNLVTCQVVTLEKTYCEICPNHTMCLFPDESIKCLGFLLEGVSSADIIQILKLHNDYRSQVANGLATRGLNGSVQPPASNMRKMTWDEELAKIAQRWADQCIWSHDKCRNVNRFLVGQNAYTGSKNRNLPAPDWPIAVASWYNEVGLFDGSKVNAFVFNASTAHYTQVVWAETWLLGCAYTYYNDTPWYTKLYFCNYGPAGNWKDRPLYLQGPAGTQCPSGTVADSDGLCALSTTVGTASPTNSSSTLASVASNSTASSPAKSAVASPSVSIVNTTSGSNPVPSSSVLNSASSTNTLPATSTLNSPSNSVPSTSTLNSASNVNSSPSTSSLTASPISSPTSSGSTSNSALSPPFKVVSNPPLIPTLACNYNLTSTQTGTQVSKVTPVNCNCTCSNP